MENNATRPNDSDYCECDHCECAANGVTCPDEPGWWGWLNDPLSWRPSDISPAVEPESEQTEPAYVLGGGR